MEYQWILEDISQFYNPKKTGRSQSKQPATHEKSSSKPPAITNPPVITNPPYNEQTNVQYINPSMILSGSNNAAHPQPTFPLNHSTSNPSQLELEESETDIMEKYISFGMDEEDDGSEYKQGCCDDDDEYIQEDSKHDDTLSDEPPRKYQKTLCGNAKNMKLATKKTPTSEGGKKKRKVSKNRSTRRTQTSYEPHITAYLMAMFFEIYSVRDKLTKAERQAAHEYTKIDPRNLTYWFSNRKRRVSNELEEYKKIVSESNGAITCYKDYLEWQDAQVMEEE
jgi:hypothetical protein